MISEITERVRPEFEFFAQRAANLLLPAIESQKRRRVRQNWVGRFSKTGVFWQALNNHVTTRSLSRQA
ncbi:MAG: hypothetical protein AAB576_09285, partial [Elusimicrobiota bacterium]